MTFPRKLPDLDVLEYEINEHGRAWVADKYDVTKQGVANAVARHGLKVDRMPEFQKFLGFKVCGDHSALYPMVMLRTWVRQQLGLMVPDEQRKRVHAWIESLDGVILEYTYEGGPVYVARKEGETGPVRMLRIEE